MKSEGTVSLFLHNNGKRTISIREYGIIFPNKKCMWLLKAKYNQLHKQIYLLR